MSDKVTKSKPFEVVINNSGATGTYATTVTNGEISSISLVDSDGNYKPVVPGTDIFNTVASDQNSLDTLSINKTGSTGNVSETILQDKEQLDKNYTKLKKAYDNGEFISAEETSPVVENATPPPPPKKPPETMRYPYDIDIAQDHLTIKQYEYKRKLKYEKGETPVGVNQSEPAGSVAGSEYTKPFGKFKGGVILPMPKVSDSNGAEWGKSDLNVLGIGVARLSGAAINTATNVDNVLGNMQESLKMNNITGKSDLQKRSQVVESLLAQKDGAFSNVEGTRLERFGAVGMGIAASKLAGAAGIDISADELLARSTGSILNPNAELLFQGPVLRDFGFTFLMVARSEAEAKMIRRIIRFFKIGAAPVTMGGPALLRTPNVFKLEYKAGNKTLNTVNKFNEMALRTITVDYAPDGFWTAYQDSHPVAVRMMLQFSELKPIYRSDHEKDNLKDSVGF